MCSGQLRQLGESLTTCKVLTLVSIYVFCGSFSLDNTLSHF